MVKDIPVSGGQAQVTVAHDRTNSLDKNWSICSMKSAQEPGRTLVADSRSFRESLTLSTSVLTLVTAAMLACSRKRLEQR